MTPAKNFRSEKTLIFMRLKLRFCEILRNAFRGFNSRRLHHIELRSDSDVFRMAREVSASKSKGFLKETVKV